MKTILFVTMMAFAAVNAQAAQKIKMISSGANANHKANKSNSSSNNNSTSASYSNARKESVRFEARPGFGTTEGLFTYGISLEGKYPLNVGGNDLFVGLETGFYRASKSYGNATAYGNTIPITPSATYEFPVSHNVKLYGGANVGIGISTVGISGGNNNVEAFGIATASNSSTSTVFLWKFRPGIVISDQFVAELPIGTIDGSFYFLPNVGVRF